MSAAHMCPFCGGHVPDDGVVRFDPDSGFVTAGTKYADLTKKESCVFECLWTARPRVLSQVKLVEALYWQGSIEEEPELKIIDVFVCKLRRKLRGMPVQVRTVWGQGYQLVINEGWKNE